jgi:membrane-bound lytic murein transglycosylase B
MGTMVKKAIVFVFLVGIFTAFAINKGSNYALAFDCLTLTPSSSDSDKEYCKNELVKIEAELQELLQKQSEQKKQTGTLKGDVDFLTSQINALIAKIKARALVISQLKVNITEKSNKITSLSKKIEREHESLAQLLRNTNEFDNETIMHLLLSDNTISNFYSDFESYSSIKQAVQDSIDVINGVKKETEIAKADLQKKQNAETDAKAELESAQKKVAQSEAEKKQLLAISKEKEAAYQLLAAQKRAQADKIRSAIFNLAGISQKIEFGTALEYANQAKAKTGIDPAFLLAILTQESNLGANVGQCYLTNPDTGAGVGKNTGTPFVNVMKPTRDVPPFLEITKALGIDPYQTAVSCPIAGVVGWGGAMGPAQFIPSTWKMFETRLRTMLGYFANPWSPRDSFMASALYLTDLGAVGNSVSSQSAAACRYYGSGGASCGYSKSVIALKTKIQGDIDYLEQYGTTR